MKNLILTLVLCATVFLPVSRSEALGFADAKTSLVSAREALLKMLDEKDPAVVAKLEEEIAKHTADVEAFLTEKKADASMAEEARTRLGTFEETWKVFRETRDGQLVPMIKEGKIDDARALAKGLQAERYKSLIEHLDHLSGPAAEPAH